MVRSLSSRSGDDLAIGSEGSAKACKLWPINRRDQAGAGVVLFGLPGSAVELSPFDSLSRSHHGGLGQPPAARAQIGTLCALGAQ